jgi:hypothetical protein
LELEEAVGPARLASRERFEIGGASAAQIGSVAFVVEARPLAMRLACEFRGETVARNTYDLAVHLPPRQPVVSGMLRKAADWLLQSG